MAKSITHCQGNGSLTHNNRTFTAKNVDTSRTGNNIVFVRQPIDVVYDEIFGAAVERYNAKQKRSDRKITTSYYEHLFKRSPAQSVVTSADKRKSFYEDLVQIGTKDDTGIGTKDAAVAAECLTLYMNGFQERNPNFRVFNAVLHMDEATPHLHIDYIPVGHYKQGVDTQNGIAQALKEMGYGTGKDAISRWREKERTILEEICKAHKIEISAPQKSRGSLTVEEYKKYAQIAEKVGEKQKEIELLDGKIGDREQILEWRQQAVSDAEAVIDKLDSEYQEKSVAVEQLDNEISEKKNVLAETAAVLEASAQKVSEIHSIDDIETGKTVFGGKVTVAKEDYEKLTDIAKKQIAADNRESELTTEVTKLKKENEELCAENGKLRENVQDVRSLQNSFSALQREVETWKQKYKRVLGFVESLGLKERLEKFLHPNGRKLQR